MAYTYDHAMGRLHRDAQLDADGNFRWESNGRVVPDDVLAAARISPTIRARCKRARDAETAAFLAECRRNPRPPTDEERFEARAAFGPGVELMDVITGQRWTT
jgi:hypothetical protein